MRARRTLTVVGCHAGGEIGDVITGGVLPPAGATVFEQMQTLQREGDGLRRMLLREPRGSVARHVNLIVPATRPDCDAGFIIMEPTEYPPMSGSNTICTTTVLLETGMLEMREPETIVRLEAPGGVVEARAVCRDGRCESVEFTNVPCFADQLDAQIEVEGLGTVSVDVAYGGMWYAIADATGARVRDRAGRGARPLDRGRADPRGGARAALVHPSGEPGDLGREHRADRRALAGRRQGHAQRGRRRARPARSLGDRHRPLGPPLGAVRARLMRVGDAMSHASAIGSTFDGRIVREAQVGTRAGIVPAIRGSAWITGISQYVVDDTDPYPEGYVLADTWGVSGLDTQP